MKYTDFPCSGKTLGALNTSNHMRPLASRAPESAGGAEMNQYTVCVSQWLLRHGCSLASGQNRTLGTSPCGVICKHSRCTPTRYIMQAVFYETHGFLNLPRLRIHSHH